MITFTVNGKPEPKLRPRLGRNGHVYLPRKTVLAEQAFLKQALPHRPKKPLEGPLRVSLIFYKKKPSGVRKAVYYISKKPDLDNYIKLAVDAMNEWFWHDDNQIAEITAGKYYDKDPRTEVKIEVI